MALKFIANSFVGRTGPLPTHFSRTPGVATSGTNWTLSTWFKRGGHIHTVADAILSAGTATAQRTNLIFDGDGNLVFEFLETSVIARITTTATFNDPTAWYHLVVRYDSTESTAADRVRFWVNNVQITDFKLGIDVPISTVTDIMSTEPHEIGRRVASADSPFDGYLADFYFCDGQALSPTDFAEQVDDVWQPIAASPTFGAEGWFLEFGTAADLGDDTSGNTNDWTENNIDSTNQRDDTPTANHVTWNSQYFGIPTVGDIQIEQGSLQVRAFNGNADYATVAASAALPKTGKYYWECNWQAGLTAVDKIVVGVINQLADIDEKVGDDNHGWGVYNPAGTTVAVRHDGADVNFTDTGAFAVGDYFMVAFDNATGNLWFGKNGTWFDSGDPGAGTNPAVTLTAADIFGGLLIPAGSIITTNNRLDFRAGLEDFEGTIPDGFRTLDIRTWPKPPISKPSDFFDIIAYDGDGVNPRTLSGLDFQPDLMWVKALNNGANHILSDIIKGAGSVHYNNLSIADEAANADGEISAFTSDGFSVDAGPTTDDAVNDDLSSYIGVCWLESVVGGFDLVGYTGTAAAQAVNHALGDVPDFMYVRNRDVGSSNTLYHGKRLTAVGAPVPDPETDYLEADTDIVATDSTSRWNDTAPTTTQFTVGTNLAVNDDGNEHAAYVWREVEGLSKFTSYRGVGGDTENAPFVYCGFRPKLIFIKRTDGVDNWRMIMPDTVFNQGAPGGTNSSRHLVSNIASTTVSSATDICASGFKIRNSDSEVNNNASEYMVMAFADVPFQFASIQTGPVGDGALDLLMEIDAQATDGHQHGAGALDLKFQTDGQGSGGVALGAGTIDLKLEIDGQGTIVSTPNAAGAVDLKLEIDGQAFNTAIRGPAVALPQLTTTGDVAGSVPTSGASTLPQLLVSGIANISNPVESSLLLRIPILQTSGEINPDNNAILPVLQTTGTILTGTVSQGNAPLPVLQITGDGISPLAAAGIIFLPQLDVTGSIIAQGAVVATPVVVTGLTTLPGLEANGFLLVPQEMVGSIVLPVLDLDPLTIIAPGAIVTGSVTLPLLRLESILVNGVTLVSTVWSMNTETLETTNYTNFDFVSLVGFADQPYGVTSGGIFLLEGDDDDGTQIDARLLTGISDRGIESLKEADSMYMQYDGGSMVFQLFPDGQQRIREYRFERRSNSTGIIHARAKGSRGLRSRSWQMGLRNLGGQGFTLDKLGLLLRILTRKTRKN